jgi:hypothetical protein
VRESVSQRSSGGTQKNGLVPIDYSDVRSTRRNGTMLALPLTPPVSRFREGRDYVTGDPKAA